MRQFEEDFEKSQQTLLLRQHYKNPRSHTRFKKKAKFDEIIKFDVGNKGPLKLHVKDGAKVRIL